MKDPVGWVLARMSEGSTHAGIGLIATGGWKFYTATNLPEKIVAGVICGFGVIAFCRPDKGQQIQQAEANVVAAVADGLAQAQKK